MSKKYIFLFAVLIISPVVIYMVWPSDETRIRKLFRDGAKAIEQKKIDDAMSKISLAYTDDRGLSYILIRKQLNTMFEQFDDMSIRYSITRLEKKDEQAVVALDVRVVARYREEKGYVLGDVDKPYPLTFFLGKEQFTWKINRTEGIPALF